MLTSSEEEEGNVLASAPTLTDLPRDGGGSGGRNRSAVGQVLVLPKSILQKKSTTVLVINAFQIKLFFQIPIRECWRLPLRTLPPTQKKQGKVKWSPPPHTSSPLSFESTNLPQFPPTAKGGGRSGDISHTHVPPTLVPSFLPPPPLQP